MKRQNETNTFFSIKTSIQLQTTFRLITNRICKEINVSQDIVLAVYEGTQTVCLLFNDENPQHIVCVGNEHLSVDALVIATSLLTFGDLAEKAAYDGEQLEQAMNNLMLLASTHEEATSIKKVITCFLNDGAEM